MTSARVFPSASFTHFRRSLWLPFTNGVIGLYVLGGDQASSIKNRIGGAPATVTGAPTYNTNSVTVEAAGGGGTYTDKGFDTGIVPTGDVTFYVVRKKPAAGTMTLISQGSSGGLMGMVDYDGTNIFNSQNAAPPAIAKLDIPTHGNFFLEVGKAPLGGKGQVRIYDTGVATSNTGANDGGARSGYSLKIGLAGGAAGRGEIAFVGILDRITTTDEDDAVYASLVSAYTDKIVIQ